MSTRFLLLLVVFAFQSKAAMTSTDRPLAGLTVPASSKVRGRCDTCHSTISKLLRSDVHGQTGGAGLTCKECHSAGDIHRPGKASRVARSRACGGCHADVQARVEQGAHKTTRSGNGDSDAPLCTDCHKAHSIERTRTAAFRLKSIDQCVVCHSDSARMSRYGLSAEVTQTYLREFHGMSLRLRGKEGAGGQGAVEATCSDCHSAHQVARKGSADSLTIRSNLAKVCSKCHEGASESFAGAWLSHASAGIALTPLASYLRMAYWILTPFVVVGLLVHVLLDLRRLRRPRCRHRAGPRLAEPPFIRFGPLRRVEHLLAVVLVAALVVSGLPQRFHDTGLGERVVGYLGGIDATRRLHRAAGMGFAALALFHLSFNLIGIFRGRIRPEMLVTGTDFADLVATTKLGLDLPAESPRFDRYDFRQKFEYWGMLVGGSVIIGSGLVLFFPEAISRLVPGELIPVGKVVHSSEAMLALLTLCTWHAYYAYFRPDGHPTDLSIFTGRMSAERLHDEHELEYLRTRMGRTSAPAPAETSWADRCQPPGRKPQ